jgi:catechol 2,3-dioxygenase-like lactoylglutathione lyase family enzyme
MTKPRQVDHVKLPVRDLALSRRFYSAALEPFGYELVYESKSSLGYGVDQSLPRLTRKSGWALRGNRVQALAELLDVAAEVVEPRQGGE